MAAPLAFAVGLTSIAPITTARAADGGFETSAPSAILIEASSGSVLFEKNADQMMAPSSMQKLMTVEVVFNEIKEGRLGLDQEYRVSENAWRKGGAPSGGSTMFAAIHSKVPVRDLLSGAIIQSGNDACIVLAEGLAGSEDNFIRLMQGRAHEIGLRQATFGNSTGLPDPRNLMSVRELATLARHIVNTYPDFYKLFGEAEFTWNKIRQFNRNPLLKAMDGADGLKTGYTKEGGYGLVGSAVQNGTRLISVVNGLENADARADASEALLRWGFRNFETRKLFAAKDVLGRAKVFGGTRGSVGLVAARDIGVMVKKDDSDKIIARIVYTGPVRAPVAKDQPIGEVKVWRNGEIANAVPLYAEENVATGSMTGRAMDVVGELIINLVQAGFAKL